MNEPERGCDDCFTARKERPYYVNCRNQDGHGNQHLDWLAGKTNQTEARQSKRQRVPQSEGCHDAQDVDQAAADCRAPFPSAFERQQRSRQQQGQKKQEMIRPLGDVTNAEVKRSGESAPSKTLRRRGILRRSGASFGERHLIERLVLVAALRSQLKILVLGQEAVDQIDGDAALVMVLEGELMLAANSRKIGRE